MSNLPQEPTKLPNSYDYSQSGVHFITLCVEAQLQLFGTVSENAMQLDEAGVMIAGLWEKMIEKFPMVTVDTWGIMPNHLHAIIVVSDANRLALSQALEWFKETSTTSYMREAKAGGWQRFKRRLWEQRFYDKLIRHESSLHKTRAAIVNNPATWEEDKYYIEE